MIENWTPSKRVLTALSHQEADRVPYFLLVTMHGAKELGLPLREYFSKAEYVAEGQLRLRAKYGHDCLYAFFYAPVEIEAWGGEVIYYDDGPANSGEPFIRKPEDILRLQPPRVKDAPRLQEVLKTIRLLKERCGDEVPIIGVILSPFSLPVMQMGFDHYLDLIHERPDLFEYLMRLNESFAVEWGNAQLEAGALALGYFDPVSSPTIVPRQLFLKTGFQVAKRVFSQIKGPLAVHFASGRALPILDDIARIGAGMVGISMHEDLAAVKAACRGKLAILGNLNGIEMRRWSVTQVEEKVKEAIAKAGRGGGFILSDNHGEIPWQVPDEVLLAIAQAVQRWGRYPLEWVA